MQVKDVMKLLVENLSSDTSLVDVACMMDDLGYDSLPICTLDAKQLEDVVFDRDVVTRRFSQVEDPYTPTAGEASSSGMLYCFSDDRVRNQCNLGGILIGFGATVTGADGRPGQPGGPREY